MVPPPLPVVLQTAGDQISEPLGVALMASDVLGALLGLFIAFIAYRGYQRNRSKPMLYLSLGFVLALGLPVSLLFVYLLTPIPQAPVAVLSQLAELVGLVTIVYALRVEP